MEKLQVKISDSRRKKCGTQFCHPVGVSVPLCLTEKLQIIGKTSDFEEKKLQILKKKLQIFGKTSDFQKISVILSKMQKCRNRPRKQSNPGKLLTLGVVAPREVWVSVADQPKLTTSQKKVVFFYFYFFQCFLTNSVHPHTL